MSQEEFYKLRVKGQLGGGLVLLVGIVMMFMEREAAYFIGSFVIFWLLNYLFIHHYIGRHFIEDQIGNPKTKTIIHPH
ncbi:MAG: hypothetical protein MI746_18280 [Pseudomonadales bacterium]|nr:hypothetical protein [Pseudomonadales bacterium]